MELCRVSAGGLQTTAGPGYEGVIVRGRLPEQLRGFEIPEASLTSTEVPLKYGSIAVEAQRIFVQRTGEFLNMMRVLIN